MKENADRPQQWQPGLATTTVQAYESCWRRRPTSGSMYEQYTNT